MASLAISLLGSFQATLDGKPVTGFESDRVRALLAYLAVECDRPHRRESLTGLLWPDWPDASALTNLRNSLANLRKAIGDREAAEPTIIASRESLQFSFSGGACPDVQAFRELTAPGQPVERLEEGIALYRGPFLEGFGLKDSPPFDEWQQRVRDGLLRQCLAALERVSEQYEQAGQLDRALSAALKQVDLAPWNEEAHRRLMRLLALNGQRSAALAQYETCRHLLQKELGVEISPETFLLHQRILNGEIAPQAAMPDSPKAAINLFNSPELPTWQIPFIGRQALTEEINARLLDPDCRLLTLLGSGGSGKTRLAAETASRQGAAFPDGVCFALLAGLQPGTSIIPVVAQALGFQFHKEGEPRQQVLNYLRGKTLLLVLDNFEHLLAEGVVVTEILRVAPRVKILVTSQVRLNLSGEHLVSVSGMEVPEQAPSSLAEALQHGSLKLFIEGARRVVPAFEPGPAELEQVLRICRLVQGTPLAILLAASWTRLLSPAEIAAEIESHSLDFLESEWQDVPERQRSLRAVFDYSWRLLSERERQVFAGLAVFRGDFSYPAAQQVGGAGLRDLMKLVNHSLLERTSLGRYRLHELVRQFGVEKLGEFSDQGKGLRDRHAAYYTAALKTWGMQLKSSSQLEVLAEMDLEIDNIRLAWSWAVEHHQVEHLDEGWEGLAVFYFLRRHLAEGGLPFQQAADLLKTDADQYFPEWIGLWTVLRAFDWWHSLDSNRDRLNEIFSWDINLLKKAAQSGQEIRRYQAYVLWIQNWFYDNDIDDRKGFVSASEMLFKQLNDRWGEALALKVLGSVAQLQGNYNEGVFYFQKSLSILQDVGVQMETADTKIELAGLLSVIGELEQSEQLLKECVAFYRGQADQLGLARSLFHLAATLGIEGRYVEASGLIKESIAIYEMLGHQYELPRVLNRLGIIQLGLGEYDQAHMTLLKSLSIFQETGWPGGTGAVKRHFGELELIHGHWAEAKQLLEESIVLLRRLGARGMIGQPLAVLGIAELRLNEPGLAHQRLAEALQIASETHEYLASLYILASAFLLLADQGQFEFALELHALSSQYPFFSKTAIIQDLVRQPFVTLSSTLPPEVISAAQKRGRARDLWATMDELLAEFGGNPDGNDISI